MCGRYTLSTPGAIQARFDLLTVDESLLPPPRYNIAPAQDVPVVLADGGGRSLRLMRWGFQPAWMRQPKNPPPINARAETVLERPMFRAALARGRCILPADGFYEWAAVPGRRSRQPIHFRFPDGRLFGFAGLYTIDPTGTSTCLIVTTAADGVVAPIHARMPVILAPDAEAAWLDPALSDPQHALRWLRAVSATELEAYPVSPLVSSVRNEGPSLITPLG